ncbi:MAG TPA: GxxExxY protein [Gemmatimonadales bacterium]
MGHSFDLLSSRVIGAAIDVHRELGPGFLEAAYGRALRIALERRGIPYHAERPVLLRYEGMEIGEYRLDLVVDDSLVVELKAVRGFEDIHFAQLRAYLKASGLRVGLLLNFNTPALAIRRVVQE